MKNIPIKGFKWFNVFDYIDKYEKSLKNINRNYKYQIEKKYEKYMIEIEKERKKNVDYFIIFSNKLADFKYKLMKKDLLKYNKYKIQLIVLEKIKENLFSLDSMFTEDYLNHKKFTVQAEYWVQTYATHHMIINNPIV